MFKQWVKAASFAGLLFSGAAEAAIPKFSLEPLTPTILQVPFNSTASVSYLVRNNTSVPRILTMEPLPGISQVVNTGTCGNPFF